MRGAEIIKTICEGGAGREARVLVQLRTKFPGIGGTIITGQPIVAALREEYGAVSGAGRRIFLKHLLLKKLDDYFCRQKKYLFPHIARPLGSVSSDEGKSPYQAYLYEWVHGRSVFSWRNHDGKGGYEQVILEEWGVFVDLFYEAGVSLNEDITDQEDCRISQNIVHELYFENELKLNHLWKRIDFGAGSVVINYEKLEKFFRDANKNDLQRVLGVSRYELMLFALTYLAGEKRMPELEKGKLEILCRDFRVSTMRERLIWAVNAEETDENVKLSCTDEEQSL